MAISYDPLIDATSPDEEQDALLSPVSVEDVPADPNVVEQADIVDRTFTGEEEQVAGLGLGTLRKVLKEAPERTAEESRLGQKPAAEGETVIQATEEGAEEVLRTTPEMPAAGTPPETVFNLNRIQGPEELKQHVEAVARVSGAGDIGKMDFAEVTSKVKEMGYTDKFVNQIINPNSKIQADPAQVYKMMLALSDANKRSFDLAQKVNAAADAGTLTDDLMLEFRQAVALEGLLARGAKQKQADVARSLAIFGQAREGVAGRGPDMAQVLNAVGGKGDITAMARAYTSAGSPEKAHKLAERTIGTRIKDIWLTTWINGILSSPVTHVKNMTANTAFAGLSFVEKQTASLIGQSRRVLFGSEDYIRQEEVLVDAYSMAQGVREGGRLAVEAWKQNKQITGLSKLEYRTLDDPFNIAIKDGDSALDKMTKQAFGYWGKFVSAPGRALLSEDEFFKAFNYRRSLNTLAYREHKTYLNELLDAGTDPAEAQKLAQQRMVDILESPPDDIHREALDFSGEMTFTKELEGKLASMENIAQHPMMKIYIPFIRTPTNIAIELNKRMPTAFVSKRVRDDWAAGGIKRDMVMARVGLSGGLMYGVGSLATEGSITGAGPYSTDMKAALQAQGWQPYSFVLDRSDIDDEQIKNFQKHTMVSVGKDKVFISYAGLEPIGAMMGIAATVGEYGIMEPNAEVMEQLFTGSALGMSDYVSELPMVSGVSELMSAFRGRGKEGTDYLYSVVQRLSQQAGEVAIGGSPAGAYSSMLAYTDRVLNPERRFPRPDYEDYSDLNPAFKASLDALRQYQARNPFYSSGVTQPLDPITGEKLNHPASQAWQRAFPFKISEGKYSPAYEVLTAFGVGQYKPNKKMDGIDLTASQYNRLIELATTTKLDGKNTLEDMISSLPFDNNFMAFAEQDPLKAKDFIKSMISDAYSAAKQQLLQEEVGLTIGKEIIQTDEEMRLEGKIQQLLQ